MDERICEPVLRAVAISKAFYSTQALQKVSFELLPGEVHALMGKMVRENPPWESV